jgi:hypothetical protein
VTRGLRPSTLPQAHTYDFADPESDGADVMWYGTLIKSLSSTTPGGTSTLSIDRGVDFYWVATTLQADVTTAGSNAQTESTIVLPLVNVLIQDAASGKNLENLTLPVGSQAGAGERCYNLVAPRVIRGSTALSFIWTAIIAAGTTYNNLYLVLHGFTRPSQWPS